MSLINDILYKILSFQEKMLSARLNKTLNAKPRSGRKKILQNGCVLSIDSVAEREKAKMEEELSLILKKTNFEPEKLLEYIKHQGTPVFYIDSPKPLHAIGENEGFIYPQKGTKALYLSLLTSKKFRMKTDEMFVLSHGEINKFYFVYHLYNWYAFKQGISGVDSESIAILNKYLFDSSEEELNKLQLSDIYKLKDAIKQDKASIDFVLKLCRDMEGAKNAFKKLTEDGTSI